jgi:hypothetical protein
MILTLITFIAGITLTGKSALDMIKYWGLGLVEINKLEPYLIALLPFRSALFIFLYKQ